LTPGNVDDSLRRLMAVRSSNEIEHFLRNHRSPYDLLLDTDSPSLLDLGAGDLSFIDELVAQYLQPLKTRGRMLTVHGLDRLRPGSMFGGPLHADSGRLARLQRADRLHFRFLGGVDMLAPTLPDLLPRYTIVTCHAPATPTFALEPSRISEAVMDRHLRKTKGEFKVVREGAEEALEVLHRGRALLFPPWKFEIRGPLALLDALVRRGELCVLTSVDSEVFWELLSQLVADPGMRPPDAIFTPALIAELFGTIHARLMALPAGGTVLLSDLAELRPDIPSVLGRPPGSYRFRYVEIRRGAVFSGMPASSTARRFNEMTEESTPWCLILVPEREKSSHDPVP
jgi:hypothetical protein